MFYLAAARHRGPINLKRVLPWVILVCDDHDSQLHSPINLFFEVNLYSIRGLCSNTYPK